MSIVAVLADLGRTNRADRSEPLPRHLNDGGEVCEWQKGEDAVEFVCVELGDRRKRRSDIDVLPLVLARATVICAIAWMSAHDAERDGEERLVQLHDEIVELLLSGTKGGEASEEGETKLSAESRRCVQSKIPRAEIEDVDRLSHAQLQTTEQHEERERTISEVSLVVSAAALRCACPPVVLLLAIACSLSLSVCMSLFVADLSVASSL